ncbi:Potassium voltage-gated channel subfamily H member 6 [Orchesella cincta]|uniref:Potassium voltage-gated channel subfamily H member 6 n=1 Tax=Orchesella cincta TaxID=48709 RepID=A0A1D2NJY9_ORCCI|nr:Potassium voltage-gated channel subfamily H member 6 [Orchesella cincta]
MTRGKECAEISFYNPIYPQQRWERIKTGHHLEQYILSTPIVFAVSTITLCCSNIIMHDFLLTMSRSVGFGNVVAQTTKEILWTTFYMIVGHFFVSYILAQLTSALSARLTPQLIFHQKLLVVETFIRHNGLSTNLLRRLVEHYDLQHQYVSGCALPEGTHLMYDGHRFVVPPDLVFVQRGEVRRELYVIVNGSVAVGKRLTILYQHGEQSASAILRSTGHFGLRDLLFGEPYPYKVKTLSYVVLYSVDYAVFEEVLGDDEGLLEYIKDELKRREDEISNYRDSRIVDEDGPSEREVVSPSWLIYPGDPDAPAIGGDLTYDHFERPFLYHKGSDFIRHYKNI